MELDIDRLDFDHCEDEPIHTPESVQSYGYFFAMNEQEQNIAIISENVLSLLPIEEELIGWNFFDLLDEGEVDREFILETFDRAKEKETRLPIRIKFKEEYVIPDMGSDFLAVIYYSSGHIVIELEPATKFREVYSAEHYVKMYATRTAPRFQQFESLADMAERMVETIRYITGMERVVLYRFNDDASGVVIAEAKVDEIESYLGVNYPASDIPAQARELYKKNWIRLTPDVNLKPARLLPAVEESGRPKLDLTHSLLRTMSPIHRQYIRNQGLCASFSMSLVTHDNLWGLISCHCRKPTYIPQDVRLQCENLSQLFSWHLYAKEEELHLNQRNRTEDAIRTMLDKVSANNPIVDIFSEHEEDILKIMDSEGFVFFSEGKTVSIGTVPEISVVQEFYDALDTEKNRYYVTDQLVDKVSEESLLNGIVGILLIPLLGQRNYFTAWFRKEHKREQKWVGLPNERSDASTKREKLTPRASFDIHVKKITGQSKKFTEIDIDMAIRFNRVFLAYVLEVQEKMRQDLLALEEQDRHRNEFLATLAHELRNPLTPIKTGIDILERNDDENIRNTVNSTIRRQVKNLTKLIDDLMDISRVNKGKIKLDLQPVMIQETIGSALEISENALTSKQHESVIHMPEEPLWVRGDPTRLSQVFSNLLNNAAKYTENGGEISIAVEKRKSDISVKIIDNGLGIPPHKLQRIFNMFTQVEEHGPHSNGGLGIGLALVKKLVELHDGSVVARSGGLDKGSEFEVILPRLQKSETGRPESDSSSYKRSVKKKILIVDDNPDIIQMYEMLLQTMGYETQTAQNGRQAIAIFPGFKPDFALLDIGMNDMNGYELRQALAKFPEAVNTVFFSQSGWGNKTDFAQSKASGFRKHFVKPLDLKKLQQELAQYQDWVEEE
ncbi:ATP-binding protein [Flavilitoribacter nigricans]|uniref:histidine kinase n=1 Tax=Flavilitoribacter nigricans (strain ATCC 23147 / DSM 23189 / NBRC 102662 / NCIMB 1420 / SS-2) TaxID=1122177 RepID=A0A2D0N9I1_FLAN2|nr:ATP-binding protein [Flavilitoribacter nigricans]PHN05137.1 histidine kinase [Flavilitoribacter nigricans DSM 23189 = NBRC 102662]